MPVLQSGSWAHSSRRSDDDDVSWRAKEFDIQNSPGKGQQSAPVVAVTFEKPDGDVVVVELNQRPLGMRFTRTRSLVVTAVHEKMQARVRGEGCVPVWRGGALCLCSYVCVCVLPCKSVSVLNLSVTDGDVVVFELNRRPLGMRFTRTTPWW